MPLDRLALILFCVVTFAAGGLWLASLVVVSSAMHPLLAILPLAAAAIARERGCEELSANAAATPSPI